MCAKYPSEETKSKRTLGNVITELTGRGALCKQDHLRSLSSYLKDELTYANSLLNIGKFAEVVAYSLIFLSNEKVFQELSFHTKL